MRILSQRRASLALFCATLLAALMVFSGCDSSSLVSSFNASVEPNLETLTTNLVFAKDVKSDLGGSFSIKDYGTIDVQPSTPETPFNVGLRLNLDIVNDLEFIRYQPTTTLPAGQPLPTLINRAMAQVKLKNDISSNFDIYAYVDILGKEWVGAVLTLKFLNNCFPAGISITKNFLKTKNGPARGVGTFFGPKLDDNGKMLVPGGMAVFVNAKALVDEARGKQLALLDTKGSAYMFGGPTGDHYAKNPSQAQHLEQAIKTALNEGPLLDCGRSGD